MHVIPPNGFPNVPSFADLDAIAKQIENIPTFTSNDRAFLEELPAFPSEDGTKVLKATTSSGDTTLSYGEIENELPANPTEDGTKVLTATTTSGTTVKSWEALQVWENQIYISTPVQIGHVGDKILYRVFVTFETPIVSIDNVYTSTGINSENIELILRGDGINVDGTYYGHLVFDPTQNSHQNIGVKGVGTIKYAVFEYI